MFFVRAKKGGALAAFGAMAFVFSLFWGDFASAQDSLIGSQNLVNASATHADHPVSNLFDGCLDGTPECTSGSYVSGILQVEFDLGAIHDLTEVRLFGDADGSWVSNNFDFEYKSNAGSTYTPAFQGKPARVNNWVAAGLSGIRARYVRVTVRGDSGVNRVQARELRLFGQKVMQNIVGTHNILSASATHADHPISNLFDGCLDGTPECTSGSYVSGILQVEFDLGALHDLTEVRLFGDADGSWVSNNFDFEFKQSSGASYTRAFANRAARINGWVNVPLNGLQARYIRVTVRGDSGVNRVQARELMVMAGLASGTSPSPTPTPNPTPVPTPTPTPAPIAKSVLGTHNLLRSSETHVDHPISNLFDGCLDGTPECTSGSYVSGTLQVEFDLGALHDLSEVRLFGDADGSWVSSSFDFEFKRTSSESYAYAFRDKTARVNNWINIGLSGLQARYVRVTVHGDSGVNRVQARELIVMASLAAGASPTPTPAPTPTPTPVPTATPTPSPSGYTTPLDGRTPSRYIWVSTTGSDSSSGTSSSPMRTVQAAVNKARAGDAIMVKAGRYNERILFNYSGTLDKPIWLISADGKGKATIGSVPTSHSTRDSVRGYGVENIVVDGFTVIGGIFFANAGKISSGVGFDPAIDDICRNIVIKNNYVSQGGEDNIKAAKCIGVYVLNNDLTNPLTEIAIDFVGVNKVLIAGNKIHDLPTGAKGAISVKGGSKDVVIRDNDIWNVHFTTISGGQSSSEDTMWKEAIAGKYEAKYVLIENNRIKSTRGIMLMSCDTCTVRGNKVMGNSSYGVALDESDYTRPTGSGFITRNATITGNCFEYSSWLAKWGYDNSTPLVTSPNTTGSTCRW